MAPLEYQKKLILASLNTPRQYLKISPLDMFSVVEPWLKFEKGSYARWSCIWYRTVEFMKE